MSTQNWETLTPLAGGLRIISGEVSGGVLDGNSGFTVHMGNIERIIKPLLISNDSGLVVEVHDCVWVMKMGYANVPVLAPNDLYIVVRTNPAAAGPHVLAAAYADLSDVEFQIVAIVH